MAWVIAPGAVPLYDGIGFPDEPYRYVHAPAGYQRTSPPIAGRGTSPLSRGVSTSDIDVNTGEQAPQFNLHLPASTLTAPVAAQSVSVSAVPVAPSGALPRGHFDGNAYRVSASAVPPGPAAFQLPKGDAAGDASLAMRATTAQQPRPSFVHRGSPSARWSPLTTYQIGNDIYGTQFVGPGDYALAFGVGSSAHAGAHRTAELLIVVVLLVFVAAMLLVRFRRSRATPAGARAEAPVRGRRRGSR